MSNSNIDVVRGGYAAFERGDMQAVFAILDPEAEFYQSGDLPWGGRYPPLDDLEPQRLRRCAFRSR